MSGRTPSPRPIIAMMGVQITLWAGIFYSFPALVLLWQADFGWSMPQIMGAFSLALGVSALAAPWFGGLTDRGLAPVTFPLACVAAALLLAALCVVPSLAAFYVIWAGLGLCMALGLYEACFALVTRARGADARRAITAITLVGGFASTLAYPLTHLVSESMGWRAAVLVLAALILLLAAPLALWSARALEAEATGHEGPPATPGIPTAILRDTRYWPLALGFALASLGTGIMLSHLLPIMADRGVATAQAILAASLIGPAQVLGRVGLWFGGARLAALPLVRGAMALLALAAGLMAAAGWWPGLVLAFALIQGTGYGVVGILRPVLTREVLGQARFGRLSGAVALPSLMGFAAAPFLGAGLFSVMGYGGVLAFCALAPLAGLGLLGVTRRQMQERGPA